MAFNIITGEPVISYLRDITVYVTYLQFSRKYKKHYMYMRHKQRSMSNLVPIKSNMYIKIVKANGIYKQQRSKMMI